MMFGLMTIILFGVIGRLAIKNVLRVMAEFKMQNFLFLKYVPFCQIIKQVF